MKSCRAKLLDFVNVFLVCTLKTHLFEMPGYINLMTAGYSSPNLPSNSVTMARTAASASGPSARIFSRVPLPAPVPSERRCCERRRCPPLAPR